MSLISFICFIFLQINPLFFISDNLDEEHKFDSNYQRVGIWRISEEKVNKETWDDFIKKVSKCRNSSVILVLNELRFLEKKDQKELFFDKIVPIKNKIFTIQLGNEIDRSLLGNFPGIKKIDTAIYNYAKFIKQFATIAESLGWQPKLCISFSGTIFRKKKYYQIATQIIDEISNLKNSPNISYVDFHNHSNWKGSTYVNNRIDRIRELVLPLEKFNTVNLLMTESSTWTRTPSSKITSKTKSLKKQSEDEQAAFLIKSALIAYANDVMAIAFGTYKDRRSIKSDPDGRFTNNGLHYNINESDGHKSKQAWQAYHLLNDLFDSGIKPIQYNTVKGVSTIAVENNNDKLFVWYGESKRKLRLSQNIKKEINFDKDYNKVEILDLITGEEVHKNISTHYDTLTKKHYTSLKLIEGRPYYLKFST